MNKLEASDKIYIAESTIQNAGKGIFAKHDLVNGDLIESCPVIEVSLKDPSNDDNGLLVNYFFYYGDGLAIALGFGSLYNHSYDPNAIYKVNTQRGVIDFTAIKDIHQDEEITVSYNYGNPDDKSKPNVKGVPAFDEK